MSYFLDIMFYLLYGETKGLKPVSSRPESKRVQNCGDSEVRRLLCSGRDAILNFSFLLFFGLFVSFIGKTTS